MRMAHNLAERVSGPMKFRFVMQPFVASVYAVMGGLRDAKTGKSPYLQAIISGPTDRVGMMKDGWKGIWKVFVLALVLDVVYQLIVLHFVYPGEAVLVALFLAIVPYVIVRGLAARIARTKTNIHT